jgi:hypothetical protein
MKTCIIAIDKLAVRYKNKTFFFRKNKGIKNNMRPNTYIRIILVLDKKEIMIFVSQKLRLRSGTVAYDLIIDSGITRIMLRKFSYEIFLINESAGSDKAVPLNWEPSCQ